MSMILYIIINVLTFILFFLDKYLAKNKGNRIPEKVLFVLMLLGGSIGALFSMYLFRHKTKHVYFVISAIIFSIAQIIFMAKFYSHIL